MSTIKKIDKIAIFHNLPQGGGIRMLENIIKRYQNKYEIDLYVIGETRSRKILGINTKFIQVYPWKGFILRNIWILFYLPIFHKKLSKIINDQYKFIILTHDYFTKSPYLLKYLKINNIYLCQESQREFYESWRIHAPKIKEKIANILRIPIMIVDQINTRSAKNIICNSNYSKNKLKKIYGKDCIVVYPGVDEHYFSPKKITKEKIILCIGGINPVKNQYFLISSLSILLRKYKLILIGKGKAEYIKRILRKTNNQQNVEIYSEISDFKLRELYRKAKVTCITAHGEPFGLSSIESQACGTPVVSINEGGPIETIINNSTGYLAKMNQISFYKKVLRAIKNNVRMGKQARINVVNNWTWDITLKRLDKYIDENFHH